MTKKHTGIVNGEPLTYQIPDPAGGAKLETFIPWTLIKRGVKREITTPLDAPREFQKEAIASKGSRQAERHTALIKALGLAHHWQALLESGKLSSPSDIAREEGIEISRVRDILQLTLLAPSCIEKILTRTQPHRITLEFFVRRALPRDWQAQQSLMDSVA